jgi:ribosome biogenesis GTPase A
MVDPNEVIWMILRKKLEEMVDKLINKNKPKIAIVGFSKSGKSTLFNKIFGSDIQ